MQTQSLKVILFKTLAPAAFLACLPWSANGATYAEYGSGNVPMNSYQECWEAADGISGPCGMPMEPKVMDSDGDGVPDDKDRCPGTPRGVKVDMNGCPVDSDGDGVPDYKDKCPGTPAGAPVDADGCALDSDGDGVPDYRDRCPNTPAGATVDSDGCMEKIVLDGVLFDFDKASLTVEARSALQGVADALSIRPYVKEIMITGHTDSTGPKAYNQGLSERRAESVKAYLAEHGVPMDKMSAHGAGESAPVADNGTREGRAKNRRVVIDVNM